MKTIRLVLTAIFLLCGNSGFGAAGVSTASPRATENLRGETVFIPHSAPEMSNFLLVTCFKITFDEQMVAIVALYDDPSTRREVDYDEVYQSSGHLLGIAWLDEFGVLRVAVDFGLIDEDTSGVTGILVLVADGNPV